MFEFVVGVVIRFACLGFVDCWFWVYFVLVSCVVGLLLLLLVFVFV